MENVTIFKQKVSKVQGRLALLIPLPGIGVEFIECARGISEIRGDFLRVDIPNWLATKLRIKEGSFVMVDNKDGKFNIRLG